MIVKTEAIVLKGLNYGETSRIVQLFSRDKGHITVMAKGSRKPGSKFGSCLEASSIIDAIYYDKQGRDIQTLSDANHINRLKNLSSDLERYSAAIRVIEFLSKLEVSSANQMAVFQLVSLILDALDSTEANPSVLWNCLRLRLLSILGFEPGFDREDVAVLDERGGLLNLSDGTISSDFSVERGDLLVDASRLGLRTFAILSRADFAHILGLESDRLVIEEVGRLLDAYVSFHLPQIPISKASKVLRQISRLGD